MPVQYGPLRCAQGDNRRATNIRLRTLADNSHVKQVAQLQEESVSHPPQPASVRLAGIHRVQQRAAVAEKGHRSGVGLVGEEDVAPERASGEGAGPDEGVGFGVEDQDGGVYCSPFPLLYLGSLSCMSAITYAITAIAATQRATSAGSSLSSVSPSAW